MTILVSENGKYKLPGKGKRPHNGGARPNSYQRRANKFYLLDTFGTGETCNCAHCGKELVFATVEADRIRPGSKGGDYKQSNLIPSCRACNARRGDKSLWGFNPNLARRLKRRGYTIAA